MNDHLRKLLQALRLGWDPERLAAHLAPFRLGKCLADDGEMALVNEALETGTGRELVVKLPRPAGTDDSLPSPIADKIAALRYEASVLEVVNGDRHVVSVVANRAASSLPYLVLQRLGVPLLKAIDADQDMDLENALVVLRDVAWGLDAFHKKGLRHNDVKPGNVLLGPDGWCLIEPAPPDYSMPVYADGEPGAGPERDVVALARTFVAAYLGEEGETEVPDGSDLSGTPGISGVRSSDSSTTPDSPSTTGRPNAPSARWQSAGPTGCTWAATAG